MTIYGVNIAGSLTNNNGILSGFSNGNYAQLNTFPTFSSASTFEVVSKIRMLSYPSESYVMIYASANNHPSFNLYIYQNGNIAFDIGNGSTWVVDSETGTKVLSLNTWYWIKVAFTGSQYILSWSEDGITWTQDAAYTTTTKVGYGSSYNFNIGISRGAYDSIFSNGEIDLTESYIKLDNNIWWRGEHKYIGTHIQLRRDVAANWTTFNPVLLEGEVGLETDTGKSKRGDGSTAWNSLAYDLGSTALQSITSSDVTTALGYTPTDINLSNLSSTGKTVLDGQWVVSALTIVNSSTTITTGQILSYKLNTYLPNDNYKYEVMYSAYGETTNTSGAVANIGIGSDVIGADNNGITVQRTRTSSTMNWGVSGIMIINNDSNRYIKIMQRDGNNSCILSNFKIVAYRRIGTNS